MAEQGKQHGGEHSGGLTLPALRTTSSCGGVTPGLAQRAERRPLQPSGADCEPDICKELRMKPAIVLVHGAWGGAWIWRRVLAPLRAAGHAVHAVTLTGVGERAHLLSASIRLQTHIDDVLGLVRAEELRDIVLVGHSYGGMCITAAADALLAQDRGLLRALAYVDAQVPLPGEAWRSLHSAETAAQRMALAAQHGGALPAPDPELFGVSGTDREWLLRRQVPHPFGMYGDAVNYDAARLASLPRHYLACLAPPLATVVPHHARVRAMGGWRYTEMATGHCPMVTAAQDTVAWLLNAAAP
jgi:pimeloyl-ACP methyl ester carboxylesterase